MAREMGHRVLPLQRSGRAASLGKRLERRAAGSVSLGVPRPLGRVVPPKARPSRLRSSGSACGPRPALKPPTWRPPTQELGWKPRRPRKRTRPRWQGSRSARPARHERCVRRATKTQKRARTRWETELDRREPRGASNQTGGTGGAGARDNSILSCWYRFRAGSCVERIDAVLTQRPTFALMNGRCRPRSRRRTWGWAPP